MLDDVSGAGGVLHVDVLGRKNSVADSVNVVAANRANARQDHGVTDLLLLHDAFETGQEVGLILEAQHQNPVYCPLSAYTSGTALLFGFESSAGVVAFVSSVRVDCAAAALTIARKAKL